MYPDYGSVGHGLFVNAKTSFKKRKRLTFVSRFIKVSLVKLLLDTSSRIFQIMREDITNYGTENNHRLSGGRCEARTADWRPSEERTRGKNLYFVIFNSSVSDETGVTLLARNCKTGEFDGYTQSRAPLSKAINYIKMHGQKGWDWFDLKGPL